MKVAHLNDDFFHKVWANGAIPSRTRRLFPEQQVLRFSEIENSDEPLYCTEFPYLCEATEARVLKVVEFLRAYRGVTVVTFCQDALPPWHDKKKGALVFDKVLALSPKNHPSLTNIVGPWYRVPPQFEYCERYYENRDIDLLYLGRCENRKNPRWVAEALLNVHLNDGSTFMKLAQRSLAGAKMYEYSDLFGLPLEKDTTRGRVEELLGRSKFLLSPTNWGVGEYDGLENAVLEAIVCGCAPILHPHWCTGVYEDYPLQLRSIQEAKEFEVPDEAAYRDALDFMADVPEPMHSTRPPGVLREKLDQAVDDVYFDRGARQQRCDDYVAWVKTGEYKRRRRAGDWEIPDVG